MYVNISQCLHTSVAQDQSNLEFGVDTMMKTRHLSSALELTLRDRMMLDSLSDLRDNLGPWAAFQAKHLVCALFPRSLSESLLVNGKLHGNQQRFVEVTAGHAKSLTVSGLMTSFEPGFRITEEGIRLSTEAAVLVARADENTRIALRNNARQTLAGYAGIEVAVEFSSFGKLQLEFGVLEATGTDQAVDIDNRTIPLIGFMTATRLVTNLRTGKELYDNTANVPVDYSLGAEQYQAIMELIRKSFGEEGADYVRRIENAGKEQEELLRPKNL